MSANSFYQFLKESMMVYSMLQYVSIKSKERRYNFVLLLLKRALKSQIKNGLNTIWKHLSVRSYYRCPAHSTIWQNILKNTFMDFFMNGWICGVYAVSLKCFTIQLSSVPSTSFLSIVTWQRLLQQGFWLTLLLRSRGPQSSYYFLLYSELLIPRYSESKRTHIVLEQAVKGLRSSSVSSVFTSIANQPT